MKVSVRDFEKAVFEKEGFKVFVLASDSVRVKEYDVKRKANEGTKVTNFLKKRIEERVGDYEVIVIEGKVAHGSVRMSKLRESHEK